MKKIINFSLILALAASFASCKKDLELLPTDTVDETKAFLNMTDLQRGSNAVYGRYGGRLNSMYVAAIASDEARFGADNAGQGQFPYRFQYGSDGTSGGDVIAMFGSAYSMIDQANRVLENADRVKAENAFEESRRPIIKGQMLAMRALGHFELLNWYSKRYDAADPLGVPVVTATNFFARPARNTVAQVMSAIEADLAAAKALLPATTAGNFTDTVLNQLSITAIQARVALYKRDWAAAAAFATTVINSGIKPLVTGTAYSGIWTDANQNEILFRIRYETDGSVGGLWTTAGGAVYFAPSNKLRAAYGTGDIRNAATVGLSGGKYFVNKFFQSAKGGRVVDIKAIRMAEMYLIRAEANAELNTTASLTAAAADINALRAQRITGYVNQTFADQAAVISAVMNERYLELAFEGFRFFDLKRRGMDVSRLASDVDSPNWQTLPASNFRFTFPIPQAELLANPQMVQNPGY